MNKQPLPERMYWNAEGYHAFPIAEQDRNSTGASFSAWQAYSELLERAKRGMFHEVGNLIAWHDHTDDWVLRGAYVDLLGDAGTSTVLRKLLKDLFPSVPLNYCYDYAEALYNWGYLSVVPVLIDLYAANYKFDDAKFIPARLSRLLEKDAGSIFDFPRKGPDEAVGAYRRLVMDRYQELASVLGSDDVAVFRGEKLNIVSVAKHALKDLRGRKFDEELRHKFEVMTGIDCNCFYKEGKIQPLAAAAVLEEFLENPAAAKFDTGVRYFFGHRIPE